MWHHVRVLNSGVKHRRDNKEDVCVGYTYKLVLIVSLFKHHNIKLREKYYFFFNTLVHSHTLWQYPIRLFKHLYNMLQSDFLNPD